MNKILRFFLIWLSLECIIIGSSVFSSVLTVHWLRNSGSIDDQDFIEESVKRFKKIRSYDENLYNCVNYSNDFAEGMKEMFGYDVKVVSGCNGEGCHAWNRVCMDISAQTGWDDELSITYNYAMRDSSYNATSWMTTKLK